MPRDPDGRTVLTDPEALNSCNGPVAGRGGFWTPFIPVTNPIERSVATVRLRDSRDKGGDSKTAAPAMAYKPLETTQKRWRRFNGRELVADVLAGMKFKDGIKVTRRRQPRP
jgi:hypothetical protein